VERYIRNRESPSTSRSRQQTYYEVGKLQVYLTEEEEIKLLDEYTDLRRDLHTYVLSKRKCRQWFLNRLDDLETEGRSISKISALYNPRELGEAGLAADDIRSSIENAKRNGEVTEAIYSLSPSEYCYSEMIKLIDPPTKKLLALQDKIAAIEDTLLRSMLMAAHEIAIKSASTILSIDVMDAAQEINMYFLESIRKYDPEYRTPKGKRVKLCTYAYGRAEKLIKEWILTTSRLVRVPRSKMERILMVVEAYDNLAAEEINLEALTEEANNVLEGRKGEDTKVSRFTIDEVDGLIKVLTSNYIHLDQPYNRHNRTNPMTIGDMISNNDPLADEKVENKHNKEQLISIMKENLTDTEFQILTLRYFHNTIDKVPRALTEVSSLLESEYGGKDYSRESIRQIEKSAISKLKDIEEVQELW